MIAEISSGMVVYGNYDFIIRVTDEQERVFHWSKSVPLSDVTEENLDLWKQEAIDESIIHWTNNIF